MLIFQKQITVEDMRANPQVLYLFGDNAARVGRGGQAKVMRGEPNGHGVVTKWLPTTEAHAYIHDDHYEDAIKFITDDFKRPLDHIMQGGSVVCPADGLGTGLAALPENAPKVLNFIRENLRTLMNHTPKEEDMIDPVRHRSRARPEFLKKLLEELGPASLASQLGCSSSTISKHVADDTTSVPLELAAQFLHQKLHPTSNQVEITALVKLPSDKIDAASLMIEGLGGKIARV